MRKKRIRNSISDIVSRKRAPTSNVGLIDQISDEEEPDVQDQVLQSPGSSDALLSYETNHSLIVDTVYVLNKETGIKTINLILSDSRPKTNINKSNQGDHVTAYVAYLHMLITAVDGESIQKAAEIIVESAKAILPDKVNVFDTELQNLYSLINEAISREDRHLVSETLKKRGLSDDIITKTTEALKSHKRSVFMNVVKSLSQKFLEEVNLNEEVAFARNADDSGAGGAKEKSAIHTLKVINELESINATNISIDEKSKQFDRIYKYCIQVSAPYIIGTNCIFTHANVNNIRKKWQYVKDWEDLHNGNTEKTKKSLVKNRTIDKNLKNLCKTKETLKTAKANLLGELDELYREIMNSTHHSQHEATIISTTSTTTVPRFSTTPVTNNIKIISKCFGDLFDFEYEKYKMQIISSKDLLYKVSARHIVCMFRAFNKLQLFDDSTRNKIIDEFLSNRILTEQGWSSYQILKNGTLEKLDIDTAKEYIGQYIDLNNFKMITSPQPLFVQQTASTQSRGI